MIDAGIAFVLRNFPGFLLLIAVLVLLARPPRSAARFLALILLLPLGIGSLWGAFFHLAFPAMAAAYIGWADSPFQYEVGIANLAVGVTCCLAFRAPFPFQAAAGITASLWFFGDAVGHVYQMWRAGNFAPGNAGLPFVLDIVLPALTVSLLLLASRRGDPASR